MNYIKFGYRSFHMLIKICILWNYLESLKLSEIMREKKKADTIQYNSY